MTNGTAVCVVTEDEVVLGVLYTTDRRELTLVYEEWLDKGDVVLYLGSMDWSKYRVKNVLPRDGLVLVLTSRGTFGWLFEHEVMLAQ